ncbi:MAG: ATP-binding protein [Bacillota bacterium]
MKRFLMQNLINWKNDKYRKPLILKGVRQCGKTYLLKEFARTEYQDSAYFNFEGNPALADLFEQDLDPNRIIVELSIVLGKKINPVTSLIIFDEVQFCPKALTFLKYLQEQSPQYHLACAGSLLGIALSNPSSFPVGKVDILTLRPLNFHEYLLAHGEDDLVGYLKNYHFEQPLAKVFTEKLTALVRTYFVTGGMPEVVSRWVDTKNLELIEKLQDAIINAYELDFAKYAPLKDYPKLSLIWQSIPAQLAKDNSKFIYGHAKAGARAKDLEDAMNWLIGAGIAYKICKIEKPALPLSAYADPGHFKLYVSDTGLLRRMSKLPASAIFEQSPSYVEFKGALTENFVLTELISTSDETPYYWRSGNTAEVDFVIQQNEKVIPVEVKSATNVRARSLAEYRKKYKPELAIKVSLRPFHQEASLLHLPLYLLFILPQYFSVS